MDSKWDSIHGTPPGVPTCGGFTAVPADCGVSCLLSVAFGSSLAQVGWSCGERCEIEVLRNQRQNIVQQQNLIAGQEAQISELTKLVSGLVQMQTDVLKDQAQREADERERKAEEERKAAEEAATSSTKQPQHRAHRPSLHHLVVFPLC